MSEQLSPAASEEVGTNAVPAYAQFAAALAGKTFHPNYVYGISASSVNTTRLNDDVYYSGQVAGFSAKEDGGVFTIIDGEKGIVSFGGITYQIMGAAQNGQSLVLGITKTTTDWDGDTTTTTSPALLISNTGAAPGGSVSFNTNFTYTPPNPVCFVAGTLIRTPTGDVPIQELVVGQVVSTSSGTSKVTWVGSMRLKCQGTPWERDVAPVRIAAGALGQNSPERDLLVSPGHGIGFQLLGDVVVPAGVLMNGMTITTETPEWVEYWHAEVEEHSLLIAEGVLAESYLDVGNRRRFEIASFDQAAAAVNLENGEGAFPRLTSGALVEAVIERLHWRAEALGWVKQDVTVSPFLMVDGERIEGTERADAIRFAIKSTSENVALCSETFIPALLDPKNGDRRELGVKLSAVEVTDGFETRVISAAHPDLADGFHDVEHEPSAARWTNGAGVLPGSAWVGMEGDIFVTIRVVDRARQTVRRGLQEVTLQAA